MAEEKRTLRDTDDEARALACRLVRSGRHAAIAVLEAGTGFPLASRVLTGTDVDGAPVILISGLAPHMAALRSDPRASLLYGEAGKGDPLAHARITVKVDAAEVEKGSDAHARIRRRFLMRHPKASLYADFPDFAFFRLMPVAASLNGGFGRAFLIEAADLLIVSPAIEALAALEPSAVEHMNSDHADAADIYARALAKSKKSGWKICGIDAAGIDLANGDELLRIAFGHVLRDSDDLRPTLAALLRQAREIID